MQKKVMIVDDDTAFLEELSETLILNGYEVIAVNNAPEAVDIAQKNKPDVILLDLKMPEKSGFQVATELKRLDNFSKVPIIAMTGVYADESYDALMRICGILTCLKKPFYPQEVLKTIKVMLTLQRTS